jgi:hypothetical protein
MYSGGAAGAMEVTLQPGGGRGGGRQQSTETQGGQDTILIPMSYDQGESLLLAVCNTDLCLKGMLPACLPPSPLPCGRPEQFVEVPLTGLGLVVHQPS